MKIIFPVAGFGTRLLKDISSNRFSVKLVEEIKRISKPGIGVAKALVPIQGTPVIQHSINKLLKSGISLNDIFVVANQAFLEFFQQWAKQSEFPLNNLISDKALTNETRLESCADINLAIEQANINDDILVIAGDTLFNGDISGLINLNQETENDIVAYYKESSLETMVKRGNMILKDGYLVGFEEKPEKPKTLNAFPSIFILKKSTLPLFKDFANKNPGSGYAHFIQNLVSKNHQIEGFEIANRFDLGNLNDCLRANKEYQS